jgi:hypothetical protein
MPLKQLSDGNLTYNKLAPNWVNFIPTYLGGGVLVCTFDADTDTLTERIHLAVAELDLSGQLIRIIKPQA